MLAVLNLVVAAFQLFGHALTAFALAAAKLLTPGDVADLGDPEVQVLLHVIANNPYFAAYLTVNLAIGMIATVALAAAGIGMFQLRPWARHLAMAWSFYALLATAIGTAASFLWLYEVTGELPRGTLAGIIFPCVLIYYMSRNDVRQAFAEGEVATIAAVVAEVPDKPSSDEGDAI